MSKSSLPAHIPFLVLAFSLLPCCRVRSVAETESFPFGPRRERSCAAVNRLPWGR
jgi:hypothetical protein